MFKFTQVMQHSLRRVSCQEEELAEMNKDLPGDEEDISRSCRDGMHVLSRSVVSLLWQETSNNEPPSDPHDTDTAEMASASARPSKRKRIKTRRVPILQPSPLVQLFRVLWISRSLCRSCFRKRPRRGSLV